MRDPTGVVRATCPCSPLPPACRDRGLQPPDSAEPISRKLKHHHPTAATLPSPSLSRLWTRTGTSPSHSSTILIQYPSIPPPPRNQQSKSPTGNQTFSQWPQAVRTGTSSVVSMAEQSRGSPCPSPPNSYRGTSIPGSPRHSRSSGIISKGSIANCLYLV